MKKININFDKTYSIFIGNKYIFDHQLISCCKKLGSQAVVVCDTTVKKLYGKTLFNHLQKNKIKTHLITFEPGEKNKTRKTKETIENEMLKIGCGRDTCLIALGGGITTDIAGFVASTYYRGIPVIYIPTTLLAMIDASIGGKTGVNTTFGKNLIGSFYQPDAVFIDTLFLKTLPKNEFKNGLVEMIKHALIADSNYFSFLMKNKKAILAQNSTVLETAIQKSCLIKKHIIEQDEKDVGIRQLLNFGHTVGHALEKVSHYQLSHGEAVALGIIVESKMALNLGLLSECAFEKINSIFDAYKISTKLSKKYNRAAIKKALSMDKKNIKQETRFVLIRDIGKPTTKRNKYTFAVPSKILDEGIRPE